MSLYVRYDGASDEQITSGGRNDDPRKILRIRSVYMVKSRIVYSWYTKIELAEHKGLWFNDASFTYLYR